MRKEYTRDELEAELRSTSTIIEQRLGALEHELSTAPDEAQDAFTDAVLRNPLVIVGGALAAGLLVGLVFGGRRDKKRLGVTHKRLVNEYVDALVEDVRYAVTKGADPDAAVRDAVQDRVPLIIYDEGGQSDSRGFIRTFFDLALKTATGFGIKLALDALSARAGLEELIEPTDDDATDEGVAPVAAAASAE